MTETQRDTTTPITGTALVASELRAFYRQLKRQMQLHSDAGDLTPSQAAVLTQLDAIGPVTTSALARAEGMRPQSMRSIVSALDTMGLIQTEPDPDDGRQTLVSLSPNGRQRLAEGRAARQDWLSRRLDGKLSEAEQAEIARALRYLTRALDQ
ncbi:MarR family winged helix-turn-helix transcriptional regulator [Salipiger profundus]|uniref:MarR family winged helix-turn-helix transcriptional regulator n=1 Tax=Salipiger profundus TaxID=1229727 RepID=UPI0008E55A74|nr:MarR family transcriptional regulator [Salipiger profundus]SFD81067.1 transcriptional regulator, MarR family [Salipiger profundus]